LLLIFFLLILTEERKRIKQQLGQCLTLPRSEAGELDIPLISVQLENCLTCLNLSTDLLTPLKTTTKIT